MQVLCISSEPKYEYVSKMATLVEGDMKAPFSIAATPSCRGGFYSIPRNEELAVVNK